MAEGETIEKGGFAPLFSALAESLAERTGLPVFWEPVTLEALPRVYLVLTPEDFELQAEKTNPQKTQRLYTVGLGVTVTLLGHGPAGAELMEMALAGSLRLELALTEALNVPVWDGFTVGFFPEGKTLPGRFERLREGEHPFRYREAWRGRLLFPVSVALPDTPHRETDLSSITIRLGGV